MIRPSFRDFLEKRQLLEENDLCMFFKKDGLVYGATESGRITFARMKNPDSKEDLAWKKDASLILHDLQKDSGDRRVMIGSGEVSELKPISQKEAERILKRKGMDMPAVKDEEEDDGDGHYGEE